MKPEYAVLAVMVGISLRVIQAGIVAYRNRDKHEGGEG